MKYIPTPKTKRKRMFTDEEFLDLYHRGLSDSAIAKKFGCSTSAVNIRRTRLHLIANFKNFAGKRNDEEELKEAEKRHAEIALNLMKQEKYKEKAKKWREENMGWIKKYNKKYVQKPEVKKKTREELREYRKTKKYEKWRKEYFSDDEVKKRLREYERSEKRKKYKKAQREKKKEDIAKRQKEYMKDPKVRERRRLYLKKWREENREKLKKYQREYKKRKSGSTQSPPVQTRLQMEIQHNQIYNKWKDRLK